jgi:hypothetical protein
MSQAAGEGDNDEKARAAREADRRAAREAFPSSVCNGCQHLRVVRSGRGSTFLLCQFSQLNPRWPKYPPQPLPYCPHRAAAG